MRDTGNQLKIVALHEVKAEILLDFTLANRFAYSQNFNFKEEHFSLYGHKQGIIQSIMNSQRGLFYTYCALDKSGKVVVVFALKRLEGFDHNSCELTLIVDYRSHGIGIGKSMILEAIRIAFDELKYHRIEGSILIDNMAAIKCFESTGFILEGKQKEHIFINEKWHDTFLYALVNANG
ncbi:MAG: GNAT family protein [Erysipelotrichaceae bacterium]